MSAAPRPIATFDLSGECPLRCRHCYYYADPPREPDLDDASFLRTATRLRDQYGIRSAFWVGGEPLLRPELLRAGMALFRRNAVSTSGMMPIPGDLGCGLLVSLDGFGPHHDRLRGEGAFEQLMQNLRDVRPGSFALSTTLTTDTVDAIDALPALVERTGALGVLVGFHVGPEGDPLVLLGEARDGAVDRLLAMATGRPGAILNSTTGLERFRPCNADDLAQHCIYPGMAIAFDNRLEPKEPCTFGRRAGCHACGCAVVAEHRARALDPAPSGALLRALFPKRTPEPTERRGGLPRAPG